MNVCERPHHFTVQYRGYDLCTTTPPMTTEEAEAELQKLLANDHQLKFVGKDWAWP